jgi:hypothetical protein
MRAIGQRPVSTSTTEISAITGKNPMLCLGVLNGKRQTDTRPAIVGRVQVRG